MNPEDLKITTKLIYYELVRRDVDVEIISTQTSWLRYADRSGASHYLRSTLSDKEKAQAYVIAHNKYLTKLFCERLDIPYPKTYLSTEDYSRVFEQTQSVVVKPMDGAHGEGITVGIADQAGLEQAVARANKVSTKVLIQEQVTGDDYRVLFIDKKYAATIKRRPAEVVGDGVSTIRQLIEKENTNPLRGANYQKSMEYISIENAEQFLGEKIDTDVPGNGEHYRVVGVANLSSGGSAQDVTDNIPELMKEFAEKLVRELDMGICGVDFMWSGRTEDIPYVIEINATPGIDMHDDPLFGIPRGVIKKFVDYLLSES